jgi:hypothetical protein
MLESLNEQTIGDKVLHVEYIGKPRFFDQRDFALYLGTCLVFRGRYNAGRPSIHVPTWIDGEFVEETPLANPLAQAIAQKLGALISPGGRLWLAYESFSAEGTLMRETRWALAQTIPLIITPLGFLLFHAGCWCGLRDWHIPEGGREGPRKLQGNKALDASHARQCAREIVQELNRFLKHHTTLEPSIRSRAETLLRYFSA